MSDHSKRIARTAPQLVTGSQTAAPEMNRSILRDLDAGAHVPETVGSRRWRLLPALTIAALAGAGLVLLLQGRADSPPANIDSDAVPQSPAGPDTTLATLGEPAAPPAMATPSPAMAAPTPSPALGPALIQHATPPQVAEPQTNWAPPQTAERMTTVSPVAQPGKPAIASPTKKPRSTVATKAKRSVAPPRKTPAASASQTTQKAAERDVDIITAIVKDIR
ncbi:MAG: hypothetical protein R3E34_01335 [Rhodocyclaceae bacterium]